MRLLDALKEGKFTLTEKERKVLKNIRRQGSFFDESGGNDTVREYGYAFFGWEITKEDLNGEFNPSGVIGSLVKKGVLSVEKYEGDDMASYYIHYELDHTEESDYEILFEGVV